MDNYCSWCSKPLRFGSDKSMAIGSTRTVIFNFCPNCVPMVKDLLAEYGPGFFPDGFIEMQRLYDSGQLFKSQKGGG